MSSNFCEYIYLFKTVESCVLEARKFLFYLKLYKKDYFHGLKHFLIDAAHWMWLYASPVLAKGVGLFFFSINFIFNSCISPFSVET